MEEAMIMLLKCMEAVKIYLLMHFLSGCKERNDKKKILIVSMVLIISALIDICIGDKNII